MYHFFRFFITFLLFFIPPYVGIPCKEYRFFNPNISYKLLYAIGFVYNEFNAEASSFSSSYLWKTRYMGIINKFSYNLSNCCYNTGLNTFLTAGFSTSTLSGGDQLINEDYYDLSKSKDFLGVNIQPFIGINSQYNLARNFKLTLGYNYSKAFHLFNNSFICFGSAY